MKNPRNKIKPEESGLGLLNAPLDQGFFVASDRGQQGKKGSVSLGDEAFKETRVCGDRRQVIFVCGCPLVFGSKPLPALFTSIGREEREAGKN